MVRSSTLKNRWLSHFPDAVHGVAASSFDQLTAMYDEPHRHYHSLDHVTACLEWFDRIRDKLDDPFSVELALWFHDVIYDPERGDNEAQSADYAANVLDNLAVSPGIIRKVCALIMVTRHPSQPQNPDEEYLIDIDLAVLGSASDVYARYAEAIRMEYAHVPDESYRKGRTCVLDGFLKQSSIYHSAFFKEKLEHAARVNMLNEKRRLGAG